MNQVVPYHSSFNRDRSVHVVDADLKTCEDLSLLFRLEGFNTSFSTDAPHFIYALERRPLDIVVLNLQVGEESGLSLLKRVKNLRNSTPVFMLADSGALEAAVQAMKQGAWDVITKPVDHEYLMGIVRDALRRDIQLGTAKSGGRDVEIIGFSSLTARERQVLQLIANGESNKSAARALGISDRTVEVHRARVMSKLKASNTADLVRIVLTS